MENAMTKEKLQARLEALTTKHRNLDNEVKEAERNRLDVGQLKSEKLRLKTEISNLEKQLQS